jgi:PDZ domain
MSNPFDQFSSDLQGALPPAGNDSYTPYPPQGGVMNSPPAQTYPAYQQQPQPGAYGAPPPSYGAPPPAYGAPPPDYGSPSPSYGAPAPAYGAPQQEYGAPPPSFGSPQPDYAPPQDGNPFGAPPQMAPPPPPVDSNPFAAPQQALVPSGQPQQSPYAMPSGAPLGMGSPQQNGYAPPTDVGNPYGAPDAGNPFGAPAPMPPGPPPSADPWASPGPPQYHQPQSDPMYGAIVPAGPPVDPFSVFNSAPAPPPAAPPMDVYGGGYAPPPQGPPQGGAPVGSGDVFADMGFGPPVPSSAPLPTNSDGIFETAIVATEPGQRKQEGDLPPGGEWYDARIFTPTLGVMFFKPQELTDSLFLNTDRETVDALAERPVVAFIVEGSSARSAGVELGHVLLKVNGVDVKNPKDASRLIKEGPRPLPLLFYVPPADVVVAEGEHMVKYDTRDTTAPNSAKDWKPKYVVIGGIIAQPWMMNMYRSKVRNDFRISYFRGLLFMCSFSFNRPLVRV